MLADSLDRKTGGVHDIGWPIIAHQVLSRRHMRIPSCLSILLLLAASTPVQGQELHPERTYPKFAVGPTGIHVTIEPGLVVTVAEIRSDSPAETTSLRAGDVILTAGGRSLAVPDPRVPLGEAIGAAEAQGGALLLETRRGEAEGKVVVKLPALGAYGDSWPLDCSKSKVIIETTAAFVVAAQGDDGSYSFGGPPVRDDLRGCLAGLFLLSTGERAHLSLVRRQARALTISIIKRPTTSNWQIGYQGILLAEYYLRTGDRKVLGGLEVLVEQATSALAAGGWGHGGIPGPGYVQSGLMNSAGVPVLTALILARECGVEVDEEAFTRALKFMYRMVGHGCVPYGDHRSELWWSNTNGRNAKLACALSLLDEPRFQRAAEHLALLVTDSYYQPEFGHTGGGFNVLWRGIASVHVPDGRRSHYRRQMSRLAWYYDLCRQSGGGFAMLPTPPDNTRYVGLEWGTGAVGLTYTAPLATLRITGAPRTKYSVKETPSTFAWGTESDLTFLGTDDAEGFGQETTDPHVVYARLLGDRKEEATVTFCAKHLRHSSPLIRTWAGRRLGERNDAAAHEALAEALGHSDPRVRRAVFDAISGYDNWSRPIRARLSPKLVSERFLPAILTTLRAPESAWWEIDGALFALGCAAPDDIRAQLPMIREFSRHEEWYVREAAFWAIVGLHADITGEEFGLLAEIYGESSHVFARSSYDAGFRVILRSDQVAFDRVTLGKVIRILGQTTHTPGVAFGYGVGGIHEACHRTMMILKHFDPGVYRLMIDDFVTYLESWEPYYQHSAWLISGSKWQPGILEVLKGLDAEGEPIVSSLKRILDRYDEYDVKRMAGESKELEPLIRKAVIEWEETHGEAD
jgi:hypothetical protein